MKKLSLLVLFLTLTVIFCSDKDPVSNGNGELSVELVFPSYSEKVLEKTENPSITIDRIRILIKDSKGKTINDQDMKEEGDSFTGDYKIAAGSGYSLTVSCYQSNTLIYQGSESNIKVRANKTTSIQVNLNGVYVNMGLSANSLSDNTVPVNNSSDKTLRISNTGTAVLQVNSMSTTNAAFTIVGSTSFSINPGNYQDVTVRFTPTSATSYNASLRINNNSAENVKDVPLTGTGTIGAIGLSSSSLDFGSVTLGNTSDKTLRISNIGNAILQVSSMSTTNAAFTIIGSTSFGITAGAYQDVTVRFAPTSATSYNAMLRINNNSAESVKEIPLIGTGYNISIQWIFIPGGTYRMGDTFNAGRTNEKPVHDVTVNDFYLSKYEVTVAQYREFCNATGHLMPSAPPWGWLDNHPIVRISWLDAQAYCQWSGCRLPTEAEWEYAARAGGKNEKWAGTSQEDSLGNYSWYDANSFGTTHVVGTKKPNGLGLYDMAGNVCEWCADWHDDNYYNSSPSANPQGPSSGSYRSLRGGSWTYVADYGRSAYRNSDGPEKITNYSGFRIVKEVTTVQEGSVTDQDGNVYKTVKIGDQWWMAENLKVTHYRNGEDIQKIISPIQWSSLSTGAFCTYEFREDLGSNYGNLYNWYSVNDGRGLAPEGWRVPDSLDWSNLIEYLGGVDVAGGKMKDVATDLWTAPNNSATNESGFTALPGGNIDEAGHFFHLRTNAMFWYATEVNTDMAYSFNLYYASSRTDRNISSVRQGISVRCIRGESPLSGVISLSTNTLVFGSVDIGSNIEKLLRISNKGTGTLQVNSMNMTDAAFTIVGSTNFSVSPGSYLDITIRFTPTTAIAYNATLRINNNSAESVKDVALSGTGTKSTIETGTVIDIDGNNYRTVKIGNQWWMAENLKVTHFQNGDGIPNVTGAIEWGNLTSSAYCVYDNESAYMESYGYLYNGYAVTDIRKIAPAGWHIPSDAEWHTLLDYLGGKAVAGGKMKATGGAWSSPNTGATNESGFSALPGGYRDRGTVHNGYAAAFVEKDKYATFWSQPEEIPPYRLLFWVLRYDYLDMLDGSNYEQSGFSIRCIKD